MSADFRIVGADQFGVLSRVAKAAGDKEMRKEILRGVNRSVKPLKAAVKQAALDELPSGGGLNVVIASSKIGTRTRSSSRNPGVRMTGKLAGHDLRKIDLGMLRHPVFGRRAWVLQKIEPGFWSRTLEREAPAIRREIVRSLDDVARRMFRG